tara:strand:+ start:9243 stop:9626 length:384 start_codon:yes stop_codon:yes gene_type:complete
MLPLIKISETIALVNSQDPSVDADGSEAGSVWLEASKTPHQEDAMVVHVRAMRSTEVLRFQSAEEVNVAIYASQLCVKRIQGPSLDAQTVQEIQTTLDAMSAAHVASLGAKIVEISLLPEDPTAADG